jgi:hypothetical protein
MSDDLDAVINQTSHDRRTFLRRLIIGTAFAVPIVSSFSMTGIQAVYAEGQGGIRNPNQTRHRDDDDDRIRNSNQRGHRDDDEGFRDSYPSDPYPSDSYPSDSYPRG